MEPLGLLFVAAGAFTFSGALFDWDWFMNSRKAALLVMLLSRAGARIFYGLLGVGLTIFGAMATFKMIEMN